MTAAALPARTIPLSDRAAWEAALDGVPHAFAHTWGYNAALQHSLTAPIELFVAETTAGRAVCPFTTRPVGPFADLVTPYGFSGFVGAGTAASAAVWRSFVEDRGYVCGYVGLHPMLGELSSHQRDDCVCHASAYVINLTLPLAELHRRLSRNRQRQLRDWPNLLSFFVHDRDRLTEFFVTHYHDFMSSRNAAAVYGFSETTLRCLCALDNVTIIGVEVNHEIVAVTLFGHTAFGAESLFNVSTVTGQRWSAAMTWYAVRSFQELGLVWLNMGGGVRAGDSVAAFKARFGADQRPLCALKQVYRPQLYAELCAAAGVDAVDRDGYFPAYRAGGSAPIIEAQPAAARPAECRDQRSV